jgi:hypothetical protein
MRMDLPNMYRYLQFTPVALALQVDIVGFVKLARWPRPNCAEPDQQAQETPFSEPQPDEPWGKVNLS